MTKKLKIAVAASPGGHLVQIRQLTPIYEKHDFFYFTFKGFVAKELAKNNKVYAIDNIVRHNPLSWIFGLWSSFRIALLERPDVVLTTGAGVVVFFCYISKMFGAKLIFIESIAKVEKLTLTARILHPISDLFFVQWPGLKRYFSNAHYLGKLI